MKYFTKEELDTIANRLIENPSYETLKGLNFEFESKYGNLAPANPSQPFVATSIPSVENTSVLEPANPSVEDKEKPKVAPAPMSNAIPVNTFTTSEIPSISLPSVEAPIQNDNINNNPINFSGNLWEPEQNRLMSTTDNFNNVPNNGQNLNTPISNEQFFTSQTETVPNPIPVSELNMPNYPAAPMGPSMFGQFEQNYNK